MAIPLMAKALLSYFSSFTIINLFTIFGLLLLAFIAISISNASTNSDKVKKEAPLPPGPAPWPIIGNAVQLFTNRPIFRWLHLVLKELNTEIACVRFGNVHVIPVACPNIALEFLKNQDALFASRPANMAAKLFSSGYSSAGFSPVGDQWKKMRRVLVSDVISPTRHQWLHDKRIEEADNLVRYVYNQCVSTGEVNIRIAGRHYGGNLLRKMVFNKRFFGKGMKDGGPGVEEEEYMDAVFSALRLLNSFCISDYFPFLVGFDLDGSEKRVRKAYKTITKYHEPIIDERMKKWRNNIAGCPDKEPDDLLDVLILLKDTDGKPLLSAKEIKSQIMEIILAAVDNPANVAEWVMAEMLNQPELLQKATEELDRIVGKERLVEESDIPHLNFVKSCAREALRLHPVSPFNLPHLSISDTTVAGYFIPKGSHVLLSRIGLGRNPKVWDDPLRFMPERHLTEIESSGLAETKLRFISFTIGRRSCVASALGTTMTIMLFARLVHAFTWSLPPNVSSIDLSESRMDLFLANPLIARATPRLPLHLYPI